MRTKYLIRLDDACPTMNHEKWGRVETLLDRYGIKPMVGVIPHNEDPMQMIDSDNNEFWADVNGWEKKGWIIALHGYNHCYTSDKGLAGLNPMWMRSEFSGMPLEDQREKIRKGVKIMRANGINPLFFFAPSHTFDEGTLEALRLESDIRTISDTIARKPYRIGDFVFIPQLGGHCAEIKIPGIWTFCLHPNTMSEESFIQTESFLRTHKEQFIPFNSINLSGVKEKDWFSKLISWTYFMQRKIRGIR